MAWNRPRGRRPNRKNSLLRALFVAVYLLTIPGVTMAADTANSPTPGVFIDMPETAGVIGGSERSSAPVSMQSDFGAAGYTLWTISPGSVYAGVEGGTVSISLRLLADSVPAPAAMTAAVQVPSGWSIATNGNPTLVAGYNGAGTCDSSSTGSAGSLSFTATGVGQRGCDFPFTVTVPAGTAQGQYQIAAVPTVTAGQTLQTVRAQAYVRTQFDIEATVDQALPATYAPAELVTATVSLRNTGPNDVGPVSVTVGGLDLTTSLGDVVVDCTFGGGNCPGYLVGSRDANGNWPVTIATLEAGGAPFVFTVIAIAKANPTGPITVHASASAPTDINQEELNGANNSAETVSELAEPTPTPSPTMTPTPSPTPSPTEIPSPSPTMISTEVPIEKVEIVVTGDPRFPITGSAAIPGESGLTYSLELPPGIGSVVVNADGSFVYTAPSTMATADLFIVMATASDGSTSLVTVTISFVVDKSLPTYGEVKPGGTGSGGPVNDERSPNDSGSGNEPDPTSTPSGGRVQG